MLKVLIYGSVPENGSVCAQHFTELIVTRNLSTVRRRVSVEDYALIIIDLDGCDKKGMKLASYIRSIPRQCMTPILFFSDNHKLEWDAFHRIHCYDFFIKPLTTHNVLTILYLYLQKTDGLRPGRTITFSSGAKRIPINIDDIVYLETINRSVVVHTTTSEIDVSSLRLSDFIKSYQSDFIQIHRSTIVNKNQIRCINPAEALIELKNSQEQLSIGKTFIPIIRKTFDGI
ncbi:MAG: LytTR family transcriptional regulator DNA-binding domain-containing protein [Eubacterium sp.]|nr:LytTR family transcriptional regulator DNA-binding domain-containing protein [Eubacterium sp.]